MPNADRSSTITLPSYTITDQANNDFREPDLVGVYAGLNQTIDSRSVSISSSTIETSYYKSFSVPSAGSPANAVGPFAATKVAHVPNADGSKVTDSVARMHYGMWQAVSGFVAEIPGSWNNPAFAWSVVGDGTPASGYATPEQQTSASMVLGLNMGVAPQGFPKNSTITATVTDGDGAVGSNTFAVKWHLPYEKNRALPPGNHRKHLYWIADKPITPLGGGNVVDTIPAKDFDLGAAIDGVLVLGKMAGLPTDGAEELKSVFETITSAPNLVGHEAKIEVTANLAMHTPAGFEGALREHPENIQGMTVQQRDAWVASNNYGAWSHYDCYIGCVRLHHLENYLADEYDVHGYSSPDHLFSIDVLEHCEFQNFYQTPGTTQTPPALGDTEIPISYHIS